MGVGLFGHLRLGFLAFEAYALGLGVEPLDLVGVFLDAPVEAFERLVVFGLGQPERLALVGELVEERAAKVAIPTESGATKKARPIARDGLEATKTVLS